MNPPSQDRPAAEARFEIDPQQEAGTYLVSAPSLDEATTFTLAMAGAEGVSEGRLTEDEATARATVRYLLEHQDPADLPDPVEIGDIVAAYPSAVETILGLRG